MDEASKRRYSMLFVDEEVTASIFLEGKTVMGRRRRSPRCTRIGAAKGCVDTKYLA